MLRKMIPVSRFLLISVLVLGTLCAVSTVTLTKVVGDAMTNAILVLGVAWVLSSAALTRLAYYNLVGVNHGGTSQPVPMHATHFRIIPGAPLVAEQPLFEAQVRWWGRWWAIDRPGSMTLKRHLVLYDTAFHNMAVTVDSLKYRRYIKSMRSPIHFPQPAKEIVL